LSFGIGNISKGLWRTSVLVEDDQVRRDAGLRPESQKWVDASLPRPSSLNWRELVIQGMHYTGSLDLARRISMQFEIRPDSTLPWLRFRQVLNPKFLILCYHGIDESGNPLLPSTSRESFESQMRFLRSHYRIVSMDEVCGELRSDSISTPGIAITFDDGYRSVYTTAFPILQQYNIPATVYLTLETVETGEAAWYDRVFLAMALAPNGHLNLDLEGSWHFELNSSEQRLHAALEVVAFLRSLPNARRREFFALFEKKMGLSPDAISGRILTWEQIYTMSRSGISFGSHTMTHPVVSQLSPAELTFELSDSKRLLAERTASPALDFAFPFGKVSDCSTAALTMLSDCGYRSAVTTVPGVNTPLLNQYELRRLQVGCDVSLARFAFDLNQALLRVEAPRALNTLIADPAASQPQLCPTTLAGTTERPDA
jgi:peptidoglycan/xylan/chitin deacetylase (PgdA/CDA1 family)